MEQFNFVIKGKQYTTEPVTVGKYIDLWKLRMALSSGTYGQMYRATLEGADYAMMMIDIEAFLSVFCPDFLKSLKPDSLRELGLEDYLELREMYETQVIPWQQKIEGLLKKKSNVE